MCKTKKWRWTISPALPQVCLLQNEINSLITLQKIQSETEWPSSFANSKQKTHKETKASHENVLKREQRHSSVRPLSSKLLSLRATISTCNGCLCGSYSFLYSFLSLWLFDVSFFAFWKICLKPILYIVFFNRNSQTIGIGWGMKYCSASVSWFLRSVFVKNQWTPVHKVHRHLLRI